MSVQQQSCAELFAGSIAPDSELSAWLTGCDLAVGWVKDEEGIVAAALRKQGAGEVLVGSPFASSIRARHQSDRFLETLGELPADRSVSMTFQLPDHLIARGLACLRDAGGCVDRTLILLHPGSGSRHKCVSPKLMAEVIERLQKESAEPIMLEGPADGEAVAGVLQHVSMKPVLLRGLALGTLAGVLASTGLFVGHDSGITHLAASLGVNCIALWGPTDLERWAPFGPHVTVMRGAPCRCADWQTVTLCLEKPCLRLSAEDIFALCRTRLKSCNPSKSLTARLVSDYPVC